MLSTESPSPSNRAAVLLKFLDEYGDVDAVLKEGRNLRKELRARIKQTLNLPGFDLAKRLHEMAGEDREALLREARWIMITLGKPLPEAGDDDPEVPQMSEAQRQRFEDDGHAAGLANAARGTNPWNPGSEAYQAWDSGYLGGREALSEGQEEVVVPLKRPRGRPKGSKNRTSTVH
jgi:hypothetical protein